MRLTGACHLCLVAAAWLLLGCCSVASFLLRYFVALVLPGCLVLLRCFCFVALAQSWYSAERPPSTVIQLALMNGASSDARNTAVIATSSGRPIRFIGCRSSVGWRALAGSACSFHQS